MEISVVGSLICFALLAMTRLARTHITMALIASMAFGATAAIAIPALGGASPLIFTILTIVFLCSVATRRSFVTDLGTVFAEQPTAWLIVIFAIYVVSGSIFLPRIFAGQTSIFVPIRADARIAEVPLTPVSGNITQSLYFALSCLCFFGAAIILREPKNFTAIRKGFMAWAIIQILTGFADLAAKIAGAGDILSPLRTATYSMLTTAEAAGFYRIVGLYGEASAFGIGTLCLLAFTFTYWRLTADRFVLLLSVALLTLLVLSTSSTAYVGGALLSLPLLYSISKSATQARLSRQDLALLLIGALGVVAVVGIYLMNEKALNPFLDLLNTMVFNKAMSASGQERAYWNYQSLQSFYDTGGLGIGLGSSRASSWVIAVISQLGIVGALIVAILSIIVARGNTLRDRDDLSPEVRATALSLRACALAGMISGSISGGAADPGVIFFIALAAVLTLKRPFRTAQTETMSGFIYNPQIRSGPLMQGE